MNFACRLVVDFDGLLYLQASMRSLAENTQG